MSIGWLPTAIAVCCRNDGSTRLTVLLFRLVTVSYTHLTLPTILRV